MSLFVDDDINAHEGPTLSREEGSSTSQLFVARDHDDNDNDNYNDNDNEQSIPVRFEPEVTPIYPAREINSSLPLKYLQEIVEDLLSQDGLLILGRGLGYELVSANVLHALSSPFVSLQHNGQKSIEKKALIFVLNCREEELLRLKEDIMELQWLDDENDLPFEVITGESQTIRKNLYLKGGIISVSSRVLVVDLLSGLISPDDVTGLYVFHAEKIRETSNDAFIINLYRDKNDWGFIKAITDEPESFTGFSPLETKLRILRVSNTFLWPRFHLDVTTSLTAKTKARATSRIVTEIHAKPTYKMNKIQQALLSCVQACLYELKRHVPELVNEYWDMENVHDADFVRIIRGTVETQWHRLTYTAKQLVYDISTLVELITDLVSLDSVSFHQRVDGILSSNLKLVNNIGMHVTGSPWLSLPEANTIINYAKERALFETGNGKYESEELPKWHELGLLLDDIQHEKSLNPHQGPVLIMCNSPTTVKQLSQLLEFMREEKDHFGRRRYTFKRFMLQKLQELPDWIKLTERVKQINDEINSEEQEENKEELSTSKTFSRNDQPTSKRRRTRGASATARVEKLYAGDTKSLQVNDEILEKMEEVIQVESDEENFEDQIEEEIEEVSVLETSEGGGFFYTPEEPNFEFISKDDEIFIESYNEKSSDAFLQEISPSHIIMYEPNISFIRRVESFQAINHDNPARAYLLFYEGSVEEQKFLLRIKKEKEAFTKLIREKANLSKRFETAQDNYKFQIDRTRLVNTRIAGGANFRSESDEFRVVVDVREFRSSLPNLLYRSGITVVPCMITVGDYIVSPKICVERKAIPDLISSFKSGRLYTQCEQMFRYYELPTLLIEFDENKSFSLEPFSESRYQRSSTTINPTVNQALQQSIQSKLLSLLIAFPKLKIIWSSSPYETAQIFLKLKANQEEPDVGMAIDKGVNKEVTTEDGGPPVFNEDPIDFIQNIPGINSLNYHLIIQKVKSIEEMVKLTRDQFVQLLGEENGKKVYNFINQKIH
ncbi:uncharacterized protein RJT21DRAFT_5885 [Scheffersomyces amazonensis]|uniref:uncharacterized protein n=1 Tax=Scheffersomyces amazonensis TaxID=1078765 RepID=UPI00315D3C84